MPHSRPHREGTIIRREGVPAGSYSVLSALVGCCVRLTAGVWSLRRTDLFIVSAAR
jgi:hypothetical protein